MRIPIAEELLTALVEKELQAQILAQADFTAYGITKALREEQPNLEIPHARVRHGSRAHGLRGVGRLVPGDAARFRRTVGYSVRPERRIGGRGRVGYSRCALAGPGLRAISKLK